SLRSCNLDEAAGIARALGFDALELDGVMGTTLMREGILNCDASEIRRLKALGLEYPAIHWTFGKASFYPAINDPDPAVRAENRDQVRRLAAFCAASGIGAML